MKAERNSSEIKNLESGGLGRLLVSYSWPALIAMSLNALYAVVDRMFIGHGCGVDAMAGLQLAMPVMMLFGAFGVFVGAGHSAILSIKLGEGDFNSCEKLLGELVAFKLAFSSFCRPSSSSTSTRCSPGAAPTRLRLARSKPRRRI